MKNGLGLRFDASCESADLYLYDPIGRSSDGGGVAPSDIAAAMKQAEDVATINVRINSPGGDVFDGMAIYSLLNSSGKTINVIIDGVAASIASVIAMVGSKISMAQGGSMMIHSGYSRSGGSPAELRKKAQLLDQINGQIAGIYAARTGQKLSDVQKMMDDETWMTADEAKRLKFVDEVTRARRLAAHIDPDAFPYSNIPPEFRQHRRTDGDATTALREQIAAQMASCGHVQKTETQILREQIDEMRRPETNECRALLAEVQRGGTPSIPRLTQDVLDRPAHVPGSISRQMHRREIREAAKHEAAHCLAALWCGTPVEFAAVDFEGNGETKYGMLAVPQKQLTQALAGLSFDEGCGRPMRGVSWDLQQICRIVEELTGDVCDETNVLNHHAVVDARELVDVFVGENASAIGELSNLLVLHAGEQVTGDVVTQIWERHQEKRRLQTA
jgi:ATP-dependent protease ClpP protease subunit